jgi:UDP-N-acetylmuramate dehydrogenase
MENLEKAIAEIKQALPGLTLLEQEPLAAHCSFRIGGPARALAVPQDVSSLARICSILKEHQLAPFLLGNGTNILFPDEGLQELFLISTEKLQKLFLLPDGAIYAEAGVSLSRLASFAQQNGLAGLEFASGIPGSVGGAMAMNAGAYQGEMKQVTQGARLMDPVSGQVLSCTAEELCLGYRESRMLKTGEIVTRVHLRLQSGDKTEILAKMEDFNARRRDKQPLNYPSAGSTFKRPEGKFAGALIEGAGLKGTRVGGAQVSEKHAGFIINAGGATARDILELIALVQEKVLKDSGVKLETEVRVLGEDA